MVVTWRVNNGVSNLYRVLKLSWKRKRWTRIKNFPNFVKTISMLCNDGDISNMVMRLFSLTNSFISEYYSLSRVKGVSLFVPPAFLPWRSDRSVFGLNRILRSQFYNPLLGNPILTERFPWSNASVYRGLYWAELKWSSLVFLISMWLYIASALLHTALIGYTVLS